MDESEDWYKIKYEEMLYLKNHYLDENRSLKQFLKNHLGLTINRAKGNRVGWTVKEDGTR